MLDLQQTPAGDSRPGRRRWPAAPRTCSSACAACCPRSSGRSTRRTWTPSASGSGAATPSCSRTTTRRPRSSTASPTSPATRWRSRRRPRATDAEVIVLAGVHFMAETAKILNPAEDGADPGPRGRLLARRVDHRRRRAAAARALPGRAGRHLRQHLGRGEGRVGHLLHLGNAVEVVESLGVPRVIFLPDEYLGRYVASQTKAEIILWKGHCEVHERFTGAEIAGFRRQHPDVHGARPPGVPARRAGRGRLRRLDRGHGRATSRPTRPSRGGAGHRVLDERQRRRALPADASSSGPATSART